MNNVYRLQHQQQLEYDRKLMNEMLTLCQNGSYFYRQQALNAEDQALRNLLLSMAMVRSTIVAELETVTTNHANSSINNKNLAEVVRWYDSVQQTQQNERAFVQQMVKKERTALQELRQRAKMLYTPRLSKLLASQVASIQMIFDRTQVFAERRTRYQ